MNLPPQATTNLPPIVQEQMEQQRNYAFELGNKLIQNEANERNTYVLHQEVSIINSMQVFADLQDLFRYKHHGITESCVLSKLLSHNLALRSSITGWRAKQIVEILQSPKIDISGGQQPMLDTSNKGSIKRI
jgi:hypothetical protein